MERGELLVVTRPSCGRPDGLALKVWGRTNGWMVTSVDRRRRRQRGG